jgi:predicted flap endonuclease-1-like 5' DNA nuclease
MAPLVAFVLGGAVGVALGELCGRPSAAEIEEFSEVLGRALLAARGPSTAPAPAPEPEPKPIVSLVPCAPASPRSLFDIEGIDAVLAARLEAAGIPNLAVLAKIDPTVVKITGVSSKRLTKWKSMAQLLEAVPGLTGNDAELLVTGVGVSEPADLAKVDKDLLVEGMDRVELPEQYDLARLLELLADIVVV